MDIRVFTQATNVVINDEFWSLVKTLLGEYYKDIKNVVIPEKPFSSDLETAWIYEILEEAIPTVGQGGLIILDGRMKGQILYNLAVGQLLVLNPHYGMVTVLSDEETNQLFRESYEWKGQVEELTIIATPAPEPDPDLDPSEDPDPQHVTVALEDAITYLRQYSPHKVIIENSIPSNDSTLQRVLGMCYYHRTDKIEYSPEVSNAFIDFIVNS